MKNLLLVSIIILALFGGYYFGKPKDCGAHCLPTTSMDQSYITTVNPLEFKNKVEKGEGIILDVRTKEEFETGHIKGALNRDFYNTTEFSTYLDSLDREKEYLIYCRSGNRSGQALELMREKGFKKVSNLEGGITAWTSNNFPAVN